MSNSQEASQPNNSQSHSEITPQKSLLFPQDEQDFFCFLGSKELPLHHPRPFFSENGLSHDIIQVTNAEPDVCLEVFYALYNTLWPQLEKLNERKNLGREERQRITSLQDAWTKFIGGATFKGVLCPPEKLIGKKKPGDIKKFLSQNGGEKRIFQNIDGVISSISHLREKIIDYPDQLLQKEEIITSLDLIESFYQGYRDQVKALGLALIEALSVEKLETSMNELVDLLEPKSVMMSDIFLDHWAYRISRSKAQKLLSLDETGCNLPNDSNEPSNHRVAALPEGQEPLVYFKANGNPVIQPEKEYKLYSLFRQLQIPVPETALLVLADVFENNSNYFYAVQASEAVTGKSALEACCKNEEIILEQEAYALQVIGTILTNPSDGSFKNFKYSPQYKSPISIDNDLVFKPEFTADRTVNVKSILYLLPQMNLVIPKSITTFFTTLDSNLTILSWLKSLHQKNQEYNLLLSRLAFQNARCIYQNLLPADEVPILATTLQQKILVDPMLYHDDHFCPQILISERLLHNILEKLQIIEKKLLQNDSVSSQVLFEEVSPILGKYYRKLRVEFADPEEALDALWGHKKNGIDYSEIHSLLDPEELDDFFNIKDDSSSEDLLPEVFFSEYRSKLASGKTPPLDKFVQYQSLRKRKNLFNISQALQELQLLIQKGLTGSQSPRDILDFCHSLDANDHMAKKIIDLFSNISHPELRWLFTLEKYFKRDIPVELRPFSLTLNGAFMKQRTFLLSESQKKSLLDDQGMIWKHPFLTGRSSVNCFPAKNPEFYLKQNPEWPGYELASILFMRAIGITHLPHQDLVIINSNSQYPVLLTQAVQGIPVCKVWKKPNSFDNLDPFHTGLLIIAAILINPEDGKEDNFILSEDGKYLIPIDNDHCFLPSTFQKGKFWNMIVNTALQTKTLLFCLDRMKEPVPHEVKQHILSLDFDSLLTSWMQELVDLDDRLYHLVDEQQRKAFLENGTVLKIPFYLQFIHNLYWKVHKIQDLLRSSSELSPFDLLKAVEPFAAKCYQGSFQPENNTLEKRFMAATNELYIDTMRGSRVSILNTQLMMNIVNAPVKGHVDDVTYHEVRPSEALKVLKKLIQTQIQNRKLQKDLICELDNPKEETLWTTLFGRPLLEKNLKDFFVNPKEGLVLQGSKLITGINLQSWFSETPEQGAKIKFLSLPNSPLLDSKAIKALVEGCPNLGYLNVSGCTNLEEIVTAKGEWPLLTRLEAKNCLKLKKMVSWSPIKILRVGTHQELFEILVENHVLEIFAISTQTNQFDFYLMFGASFQIKSLQKDQTIDSFLRSALTDQVWFENFFKSPRLTIGTHSILAPKDLAIFITQLDLKISTIDFKAFQEMVRWNFKNLKVLELPFFRGAGTKFFEALAQGDWPKLTLLNLTYFEVDDEGLAFLSQGNWPLLEIFTLGESKATKKGFLNFVASPNLFNIKEITFSSIENPIAKTPDILFPKHWHMLEELDLSSSEIVQIEIEIIVYKFFWPNLKNLNLSNTGIDDNAFGVLSQGNWPLLEKLNLFATKITYKSLLNFYSNNKWPKLKFKEFSLPSHIDLNLARSLHEKTFQGERLEFANLELGLAEITLLVKKYQFKGLKYLDLSNNKLFDEGISLLSLAKWSSLEDLNVENVNFTSKSIDNIVRKSKWKKLKSLKLSNNQISDDGISSFTLVNWPQLEKLNVQNTNIAFKEVSTPLKWGQLKYLNISNNAISDEGLLFFATGEWPVLEELGIENIQITEQGADILVHHANLPLLKKLDISQNIIGDEGLKTLASAKWPNFQHLVYYETKVTLEGNIAFLKSIQWSNLSHLEHSLVESFYSLDEPSNICYTTETVLAVVPRDNKRDSILVTVLDATWLDSKEINLSLRHKGTNRDVLLLPKDTLHEFEEISFSSFSFSVIGFAIWPKNLKKLEITDLSLSGPDTLERLFSRQCPLLEDLNLENTAMTTRCIEILVIKSDWPFLKKLCISRNKILDEGLKFLISKEWPLIESLNLRDTGIAEAGIGSIAKLSKWPKLKTLDISDNSITDKGLKLLSSGKWLELENLYLKKTLVTTDGIESMINLSEWPNLHTLDISHNLTYDKGLQILSSKKWLKLKNLSLRNSSIPVEGIKGLVEKFPSLQSLDLSDSNISHQGLVLLSSGKWPLFESLTLKNTLTSGEGIKSLAGLSNWPNLKVLDVSNNSISDTGIKLLSSAKWLLLENLNISQTDVTSVGISHIIQAANWPNLKILDVSSNSLSEGIKFLSSGKWPLLENLNIQQTNISFSGIKQMIEAAKWSNLKEIHIQADPNSKTALAVEQLISAKWPECKMYASQ